MSAGPVHSGRRRDAFLPRKETMETFHSKASEADLSGLRIDRSPEGRRAGGVGARRAAIAVVAAVAALLAIGFAARRAGLFAPEVAAATARLRAGGGPAAVLTANGYVVAQRKAAVASKATGRLAELFVEEGSAVTAGQVLGRLEHADYDAEVLRARADFEAARAAHARAQAESALAAIEFGRQEGLLAAGQTDQATHDRARSALGVAVARVREEEANVRSRRAELDFAEANQEYTKIRAPFDATVLRKNAEVGEIVAPVSVGAAGARGAIVDLADMASLEVEVDVNEAYIARIAIGQRAEIRLDAYADRPYGGFVRQIVPTADRQKATVVVKVHFDALDRYVLPEMGAKVTFQAVESAEGAVGGAAAAAPTMRVFVPQAALSQRDGRGVVLVVENGRVRVAPVETGETSEGEVEVRTGLRGGESVIVSPPAGLNEGSRVRIKKGA